MKIFRGLIVLLSFLLGVIGCRQKSPDVFIAVNKYIDHPNLDKLYDGVLVEVNQWSKEKNRSVEFDVKVANGDVSVATQIAKQEVLSKPNLILALATPSAQACKNQTNTIPIVFGAITDPVSAGLVESYEKPGTNLSGTSDQWPYDKQFQFMRDIYPKAKTIGIIYNPGESNSVASVELIKRTLPKYGFSLVEATVSSTNEIISAASSLIGRCDLLFAPADNTVLSGIDAYVKISRRNKIPLFVGDEGSVEKGGLATYGIDYYDLGIKTGQIVVKVLNGEDISQIPVAVGTSGRLIVNKEAMKYYNVTIPEKYLKGAIVK